MLYDNVYIYIYTQRLKVGFDGPTFSPSFSLSGIRDSSRRPLDDATRELYVLRRSWPCALPKGITTQVPDSLKPRGNIVDHILLYVLILGLAICIDLYENLVYDNFCAATSMSLS